MTQHYTVRITGPGIDHAVMVNSLEDFDVLELIIKKMRKHFAETACKAFEARTTSILVEIFNDGELRSIPNSATEQTP